MRKERERNFIIHYKVLQVFSNGVYMVLAIIKKTGSREYADKIDTTKDVMVSYLGQTYEEIEMNDEFVKRNIIVISNPLSFETGLEPNLFVINNNNEIPCQRILFGNVLFYKRVNGTYEDLTLDDQNFIKSYIDLANLSEDEKSMAGLFEYSAEEVGYKFNHKKIKK